MLKLIDFYADWCGPCQMMNPILAELEKEMLGQVEFVKVNVDQEQSKAADYGVLSIPTYVIEKEGKEMSRKIGAMSKETLKNWIQPYL